MVKTNKSTKAKKRANQLQKFLKETKQGRFAQVDKNNLKYSRLEETIESINTSEDNYYYSLS